MNIQIRAMTEEDRPRVLAIARSLAAWFKPLDQMALSLDLNEHRGLVALDGEEIIGFLTFHIVGEQAGELSWFGVLRDRRAQGVGSALLARLELVLKAEGVETIQLSTVPGDHDETFHATTSFYHRHGFVTRRRDENFYAHGRPRLLLEKKLADSPNDHEGRATGTMSGPS